MLETRAPAVVPMPILTLPRGCLDIRNSRAARFDRSTILLIYIYIYMYAAVNNLIVASKLHLCMCFWKREREREMLNK